MATEPKKTQDDDPLQRAASQGFADPPTPEPTTEQLQRAMHPTDYEEWKAREDARMKKAAAIKDASIKASVEADEEIAKADKAADEKNKQRIENRSMSGAQGKEYQTRAAQPQPPKPAAPPPPAPPKP